jgi:hypothetical protein
MEKPNIWRKKLEEKTNPESILIAPAKKKTKIADIDVTFDELKNPSEKESLIPVFELLRAYWVGENKERGIGTTYVYFDEEGHIHMDFASRFALQKDSQAKFLKVLRRMMRD